jgi:hypothetical protein
LISLQACPVLGVADASSASHRLASYFLAIDRRRAPPYPR